MHTAPASLPYASGLQSFLQPRAQTSASAFTQVQSETRTNADITVMTADGDRVTLSADTVLQAAYASYDARGRMAAQRLDVHADAWQLAASHHTTVTVEGNLDDKERTDIQHLMENLGTMVTDFLAGDLDDAVVQALDLGKFDTLAGFEAAFEYVEHVRVEQQYTAQGSLHATPPGAEKSPSSAPISPRSIGQLLDRMIKAVEASQVDPKALGEALPKFPDEFIDQLSPRQGAEALKTRLAERILTTFTSML